MNINRILALNIPDIHPAYGGVRGKTMSSRSQGYAWPVIKDAGVHTIIDLRNDGMNQRMQNLCEKYGMEYFYYPVDNRADVVESMVSLFLDFCERIDRGGFYIACAKGCTVQTSLSAPIGCSMAQIRERSRRPCKAT